MGGSCGEPKGSPVLSRYANPHESAHPIGVGEAEKINRFDRSRTMSKSKRASAPAVSAYIPVVRRSYKPRPDGHDPFFDLPFVSHSKRDGYVAR